MLLIKDDHIAVTPCVFDYEATIWFSVQTIFRFALIPSCAVFQVHYHLRAMVLHIGLTATTGHYEAIVLHADTWMRCSDNTITEISTADALKSSSSTYMCIYTGITFATCLTVYRLLCGNAP